MGVDGDFYDFLSYGPDYVDLSIADVMGKGHGGTDWCSPQATA